MLDSDEATKKVLQELIEELDLTEVLVRFVRNAQFEYELQGMFVDISGSAQQRKLDA